MRFHPLIRSGPAVHILFWLAFYALYIKLGMATYASPGAVLAIYFGKILVQALAAYVLVYLLMPRLLYRKRYVSFAAALLGWSYVVYALLVLSRSLYLEPAFGEFFKNSERHLPVLQQSVAVRLFSLNAYLDALPWLFTPAAFMGLVKFYRAQLRLHRIAEEKKGIELQLLKAQLNPHFLFNTLNNLYVLALKKDDRAPEAIAQLSEILDFILYRCQGDFIGIRDAIRVLQNFIALENLRYGPGRLQVEFSKTYEQDRPVPLLIFLTLLENAFKHGVTNETKQARISIFLAAADNTVRFGISNSKPLVPAISKVEQESIGLKNIAQQLRLLYPSRHELHVENGADTFAINLVLYEH